ncbi:DUF5701 family protein [Brachybacterium muris]|uniref:DUF5701 family protein n=1 Tax=Brachybacterium muris TaxID=219301 RepID=UPI001EF8A1A6|nr:DUF5701 family protein [Brachybacterium muris]MCT1997492.1 DUF5701 family protein [Brachybacterium muris]MCT2296789.1 DUF5701 family protein [Brachybacterium muris]
MAAADQGGHQEGADVPGSADHGDAHGRSVVGRVPTKERKGAPKVGWCWANNRHTWLGFGSAASRSAGVGAAGGSGHLPWSPW